MQFMAKIVLSLPGDWSSEKLEEMNLTERARSMKMVADGKLGRKSGQGFYAWEK